MIRRLIVCLLAISFTALAVAADDPRPDQPDPLVKKKRPEAPDDKPAPKAKESPKKDADPKKDTEPKKDGDPKDEPPAAPAEDEKMILERINKNMKESEDRLKKNDPGDATRQVQKDIVTDLDSLIKQAQQQAQQNQPQGGGGGSSSKNSKDQQSSGKSSSRSKRSPSRSNERQPGDSSQTKPGSEASNQGGAGKMGGNGVDKLADSFKDIWGHLPETLRMEMDAYAKEQFMAKYSDLLKQYYSTIAERKRRGEEEK